MQPESPPTPRTTTPADWTGTPEPPIGRGLGVAREARPVPDDNGWYVVMHNDVTTDVQVAGRVSHVSRDTPCAVARQRWDSHAVSARRAGPLPSGAPVG